MRERLINVREKIATRLGSSKLFCDRISSLELDKRGHAAGTFSIITLRRIEKLMPKDMAWTAETGCGKSTILFSNLSKQHTVFCLDDREYGTESSLNYFQECELTRNDRVEVVFGPTQKTLALYENFRAYDCVLIDGPHGYPFPEMEYYYFYPHIRTGGLLIIDDVHIPTIGRLAEFIGEDDMFELVEVVNTTAVFRRTSAPTFNPFGDGWWEQSYNRRRVPQSNEFHLNDGKKSLMLDKW